MLGGGAEIQMGREVITDVALVPAEPRGVQTRAPGVSSGRGDGHQSARRQQRPKTVGMQETARSGSTGHDPVPRCRGQRHPPRVQLRRGGGGGQTGEKSQENSEQRHARWGQSRPRMGSRTGGKWGEPRGGRGSLVCRRTKMTLLCDFLYSFSAFKKPKGKIQTVGMTRQRTGYTGRMVENRSGRSEGPGESTAESSKEMSLVGETGSEQADD